MLAYDIFWLSKRTYSNIKYLKINAIILKNYWSKDSIENLKMMIITKENLHPFDKINYIDLSNLSKKYGIHEKVLAIDILGITETMYHTIKYHQNTFTCILKNDSLSKTQLQELRIKIFEAEKLYEGYRISYLETKVLLKKYKIKLYDLLYILGITEYSYYVIKEFQQQKAIIKDTEKALNLQILNQLLDKNRYYNYEEINHICEYYNISILDFINYVIGNAKYFGYTDYLDLLNKKGIIWIGEKCKLSSEFVKQNINELQKIALTVSKKAYAHFYNTDSINIDKDDLFQESLIFILTKCGDLEKNFEGEDLSRMIYLRTKITIFNKMRIHFRNNDFRTKDDIDLEVLGECDETLENDAFESLEKISLLEKEKINLEEIKKKLLENEMVKETVDGHYILGEEDIMKINLLLQNKTEEYH